MATVIPKRDDLTTILLCLFSFAVFWASPAEHMSDNRYSVLLSESLLDHHSFELGRYFKNAPWRDPKVPWQQGPWQLMRAPKNQVYYVYPPGASLLSLPFVAACRWWGWSSVHPDGSYNIEGDAKIQSWLSALLMSILVGVVYRTARILLPKGQSLALALVVAFGTSVWSIASQGLWTHTWVLLLLALVFYLLLSREHARQQLPGFILGSLAAWLYIVRPTGLIVLLLLGAYFFLLHRQQLASYIFGALPWLVGFFAYSGLHFDQMLPVYYRQKLSWSQPIEATLGSLFSPSRGLFFYSPVLLWVLWQTVKNIMTLPYRALAACCVMLLGAQQLALSGWRMWWGGQTYGPRLSSDMLPCFILLAVLALAARNQKMPQETSDAYPRPRKKNLWIWPVFLGFISVLMHAPGALSNAVQSWNQFPKSVDIWPKERLWDWKHPQALTILGWPFPWEYDAFPPMGRIFLERPASNPYLWIGWSPPDGKKRWTTESHSDLYFAWNKGDPGNLRIKAELFTPEGRIPRPQRVKVMLNSYPVHTWNVTAPGAKVYKTSLPANLFQNRNMLRLQFPDSQEFKVEGPPERTERRALGVWWVQIQPPK